MADDPQLNRVPQPDRERLPAELRFLEGGGEMGAQMRSHDWSKSPLGDPADWQQSLKSVVGLLLSSKFPMFVAWGEELGFLYNDPYSEILGAKHPAALGSKFYDIWSEIWPDISPLIDAAMSGQATYREDLPLIMNRKGFDEQTFFTFSYSPVRGDDGSIAGMFCACTETTEKVMSELRVGRSEDRMRALLTASSDVVYRMSADWTEMRHLDGRGFIADTEDPRSNWIEEYIFPEDRSEVRAAIDRAIQGKSVFELEHRVRRVDGSAGWTFSRAIPILDAQGEVIEWFGMASDITARKNAVEALRDSEQRFRNLLSTSNQVLYRHNADWSQMRQLSGGGFLADTDSPDPDWFDKYIHPEDQPHVWDKIQEAIRNKAPFELEHRVIREDGTLGWTHSRSIPILDEHGEIVEWFGAASDVSDRKQSEIDIHESEERYRDVFEHAGVGMVEIDSEWRILKANRAYCDISGRSIEELNGLSSLAFTHPDDIEISKRNLEKIAAGSAERVSFEKRYVRPDGQFIWVRNNIALTGGGDGGRRFLKVVEDITGEKLAQQAAHEKSQQLETLNRIGSALAAQLDLEVVVQMVTDAGVELTGAKFGAFFYNVTNDTGESYTLYTLSGAERSDFEKFGMPRKTQVFGPTFEGAGVVRSDDITKDPRYGHNAPHKGMPKGHLPVASYLAVPVKGLSGEVIGGLFFGHPERARFNEQHESLMTAVATQAAVAMDNARLYRDAQREIANRQKAEQALLLLNESLETRVAEEVDRRSQSEEALRQLQKMETVGQLTGGIAHDFNNLLQIVSGNLDILRRNLPEDAARLRRPVDNAMRGAERAAVLTQRLLAFSRRQPLAPKLLDPNKLVSGMSEMLHRTLGETYSIETVLASGLWRIEADPNQLESALLNLAVNARDAMPQGGKLTIETANTHLDRRYAEINSGAAPGQYVVICVTDTGEGMDPETAEKAFEPFFTTKGVGKGTGLGLSMVYGFVKQSGGHIKIYSEEGEGTTVKIYLPRYRGTGDLSDAEAEESTAPGGDSSATILVCEDDEDVRALSAESLRGLGYSVVEAADGEAALRMLQGDMPVDLLFTDVVLPGMTGAVLAKEARAIRPELKVLFTTGYARNAIVHQGRLDPGVELISKPFSYSDLAIRIRDLLDAPPPK